MSQLPAGDIVWIAPSGTVERDDKCGACGARMYYRTTGTMFCGNVECEVWLAEVDLG